LFHVEHIKRRFRGGSRRYGVTRREKGFWERKRVPRRSLEVRSCAEKIMVLGEKKGSAEELGGTELRGEKKGSIRSLELVIDTEEIKTPRNSVPPSFSVAPPLFITMLLQK